MRLGITGTTFSADQGGRAELRYGRYKNVTADKGETTFHISSGTEVCPDGCVVYVVSTNCQLSLHIYATLLNLNSHSDHDMIIFLNLITRQ